MRLLTASSRCTSKTCLPTKTTSCTSQDSTQRGLMRPKNISSGQNNVSLTLRQQLWQPRKQTQLRKNRAVQSSLLNPRPSATSEFKTRSRPCRGGSGCASLRSPNLIRLKPKLRTLPQGVNLSLSQKLLNDHLI